jgi:hypothetical protein
MRLRIPLLALATTGLMAAAGCDEKLSTVAGPTPNLEPTFASVQREIFQTTDSAGRALCVGCHTNVGRNPASGLNLLPEFAHANLVNVPSVGKPGAIRVIPGDPENSYLIHKLEGRPGIVGQRMPRTAGPFLTEGQILIIKRWIALGARND